VLDESIGGFLGCSPIAGHSALLDRHRHRRLLDMNDLQSKYIFLPEIPAAANALYFRVCRLKTGRCCFDGWSIETLSAHSSWCDQEGIDGRMVGRRKAIVAGEVCNSPVVLLFHTVGTGWLLHARSFGTLCVRQHRWRKVADVPSS
jgi:hypothetical protein